jgi:glycosyl transferase family 1
MRILVCTFFYYYNNPRGIEPQFYYLYRVPEKMGFDVEFFDYQTAAKIGLPMMRRLFLNLLRGGQYDAVFIATHRDEFDHETLAEARKHAVIFAWNSDDEWRWDDYSSRYVEAYSFMVTNSPAVYAAHKSKHPNLLYAQWACTGFWDGRSERKTIAFSFVGQVYGQRAEQIKLLAANCGLHAYGKGTQRVAPIGSGKGWAAFLKGRLKPVATRLFPELADDTLSFEEVNTLWNRTRVSFTPLDSSTGQVRQIKSRVFDMGLSGTLMLAHRAPHLDTYYEPDNEYVPFDSMEECIDKAKYYLQHESERQKISDAYAKRTLREHMWEHRITHVLKAAGLR